MIRPTALFAAAALAAATPALAAERSFPVGDFQASRSPGRPTSPSPRARRRASTRRASDARSTGSISASRAACSRSAPSAGARLVVAGSRPGNDHGHRADAPAVDVAGSGDIAVDHVKVRDFAGNIAGSGSLHVAALDADAGSFDISGSGTVTAAGRCGTGSAKIAGSGDLKLGALKCATLSAQHRRVGVDRRLCDADRDARDDGFGRHPPRRRRALHGIDGGQRQGALLVAATRRHAP